MGLVFEKTERVTDVAFVLDDGTGRIDCHRWYVLGAFFFFWVKMVVVLMFDERDISDLVLSLLVF